MQVILLDKVANLGDLGEEVKVRAGYARNYLIPRGKAVLATKSNIEYFETRRAELIARLNQTLAAAQERVMKLEALGNVTIPAKAGEEGKLFGSVGTRDIAEAVSAAGVEVIKSEVRLPHGALRSLGEHEVTFQLHSEVTGTLNITIVPEQ